MPQRPTHRLNLYLVPEQEPSELRLKEGLSRLEAWGVLDGARPGPRAEELVAGGFAMLRVDRPGRTIVYGNRQGGYRVRCPGCEHNLVPEFNRALATLSLVSCPGCAKAHRLRDLHFAPPVAFGRCALELRRVGAPELRPAGAALLREALGDFATIGSRG